MTLWHLFAGTAVALVIATAIGRALRRSPEVDNLNARILAWWALSAATALAVVLGPSAVWLQFALFSAFAVRNELARGETLLLILTMAQFALVRTGRIDALAAVTPVGGLLAIAVWNLRGETRDYLDRTARQYWTLMVAAYGPSFVPAIMMLDMAGREMLVFYFLVIVESGDIFQYLCGKLLGRNPVAPRISPNKTWEGLLGGIAMATALGTALYRATPFRPWQAGVICASISVVGFLGGLTMSAVKRQRGIKDFGTVVHGHGGMMDRLDSLCFTAPLFYLVVRYGFAR